MFEIPLPPGANLFLWIFVILVAFVVALMVIDVVKGTKTSHTKTKEKKLFNK